MDKYIKCSIGNYPLYFLNYIVYKVVNQNQFNGYNKLILIDKYEFFKIFYK